MSGERAQQQVAPGPPSPLYSGEGDGFGDFVSHTLRSAVQEGPREGAEHRWFSPTLALSPDWGFGGGGRFLVSSRTAKHGSSEKSQEFR